MLTGISTLPSDLGVMGAGLPFLVHCPVLKPTSNFPTFTACRHCSLLSLPEGCAISYTCCTFVLCRAHRTYRLLSRPSKPPLTCLLLPSKAEWNHSGFWVPTNFLQVHSSPYDTILRMTWANLLRDISTWPHTSFSLWKEEFISVHNSRG